MENSEDDNGNAIELLQTKSGTVKITEIEDGEVGFDSYTEGKRTITEPDGSVVKENGKFDNLGHIVEGERAKTGPGGNRGGSKFENGIFNPQGNLIKGTIESIEIDGRVTEEEVDIFGYGSRGSAVVDGSRRTRQSKGPQIIESGKFDPIMCNLVEGERVIMEKGGKIINETGKFDSSGSLVMGERTTKKPGVKTIVEDVGKKNIREKRKTHLIRKITGKLRNSLKKLRNAMQRIMSAVLKCLYTRRESANKEFDSIEKSIEKSSNTIPHQ
ncbi:MAG: hypothetical protein LBB13_03140 [Rickettsiales bacterium]|jgi:hypothetical protein|nr:hypothetical protein [Rickettsiales bacterium]